MKIRAFLEEVSDIMNCCVLGVLEITFQFLFSLSLKVSLDIFAKGYFVERIQLPRRKICELKHLPFSPRGFGGKQGSTPKTHWVREMTLFSSYHHKVDLEFIALKSCERNRQDQSSLRISVSRSKTVRLGAAAGSAMPLRCARVGPGWAAFQRFSRFNALFLFCGFCFLQYKWRGNI